MHLDRAWIERQMLRDEPEKLFVFGDNLARIGKGGQAKEMRGEPNAVGLPTKVSPSIYLSDSDLAKVSRAIRDDLDRLMAHLRRGGTVVWPSNGIGTGLAELDTRAPHVAEFYAAVLLDLSEVGGAGS